MRFPMRTAIISDLHLGTIAGTDVARREDVAERLFAALAPADRVVVLGDLLELRERPAAEVLELTRDFLGGLGDATAGKQVVIVPGNHDYELVAPALDAARLQGGPTPAVDASFSAATGELSRRVAELMPRSEVVLAYPGIHLREDVFATHGHYLDAHLTVPRLECIVAGVIARIAGQRGDRELSSPAAYEATLAPLYAFAHAVVQTSPSRTATKGGNLSRSVWRQSNPGTRRSIRGWALGGVAIPAAVGAINRIGIGPFRADISALELRRAGLRAMAQVVAGLGIDAPHVIFGHTHRAGPLPGEVEGWWLRGGSRLTNTGSWLYETAFVPEHDPANPYWPGRITWLGDTGAPEHEAVLAELEPGAIQLA